MTLAAPTFGMTAATNLNSPCSELTLDNSLLFKETEMAKKEIAIGPQIERENRDWGVRLSLRPFRDPRQNTTMQIEAEINHPKPGRTPPITVRFTGVPTGNPLPSTDAAIWNESLRAVLNRAREIAAEMKAKAKKATKKAPKKKKS